MATNDGFEPYPLGLTALEAKNAIEKAHNLDAAGVRAFVESATDSNVFTDADHTKLDSLGSQNVKLNTKLVDIGDWDMNNTLSISVAHGLTLANIRTISVLIRNDSDQAKLPLWFDNQSGSTDQGFSSDATNIYLYRATGGFFDNSLYENPPSGNRGWITIQYVD
jgi:hypothetical protein